MKNIRLVVPNFDDYSYKEKIENDKDTMSYNAGYDVSYEGYNYDTGCIKFNKDNWKWLLSGDRVYFAYILDCDSNNYVGYVTYEWSEIYDEYECSVLIEHKYRKLGYGADALKLLIKEAYKNGIDSLYDTFEKNRSHTFELFKSLGFKIFKESRWKKFGEYVDGVVVYVETKIVEENC